MTDTNANEYLNPRFVFSLSMCVLAVAGLCLIFINTLTKASGAFREVTLTKALWKFDLRNSEAINRTEQRRAWYKLVCAGVMLSALAASVLVRFAAPLWALGVSVAGFAAWLAYLFYYWHAVVTAERKSDTQAQTPPPQPSTWSARTQRPADDQRLPVTVVTGFLGSGKTTLLQHMLNNTVGMKILVIENEIGEQGIDHELLMQHTKKEDIVLLNNGCICCTVRNDLLTTFKRMFSNEAFAQLDWIVIETTGLADPAPLIQSFYMDKECQKRLRVDGVLTVVDGKHLPVHLAQRRTENRQAIKGAHGGTNEAILQISFADRILLNKADLLSRKEIDELHSVLSDINPTAQVFECSYGIVDIQKLLDIKAFDPAKCMYCMKTTQPIVVQRGKANKDDKPKDNALRKKSKSTDDRRIMTFSFVSSQPLDLHKFNDWISRVLQIRGANIFRLKGILRMAGYREKFFCHGVHMLFDGEKSSQSVWEPEGEGESRLVFIGVGLDQEELQTGFESTICEGAV